jgi:hypothetical protein
MNDDAVPLTPTHPTRTSEELVGRADGGSPSLVQDLSVVAWLQTSEQLSAGATGYLCDALLQWVLLTGEPWPDPAVCERS